MMISLLLIKDKANDVNKKAIYRYKRVGLLKEDLVFLRPNHGIDAREYKKIIGKKIKKDIQPFEKLIIERKK